MAWTDCPHCGHRVTDRNELCMHCNGALSAGLAPRRSRRRTYGMMGLAMAGALVVGGLVFYAYKIGTDVAARRQSDVRGALSTNDALPNYTDEAGEFAVAFPIAPKLETATESTQMGPFVRHTAMASVNADHIFAVSWGDLGAEGTPLNIDGMLDGAATAEVSSVGATLVSKKTIKLGTVPGREVTARVILEKACTLRSRIFQSGRRQYQLVTIVPTADATTAVDAFFSSFKFTS